jgi:hypothetical protein
MRTPRSLVAGKADRMTNVMGRIVNVVAVGEPGAADEKQSEG